MKTSISIIGGGNLGSAIAKGLSEESNLYHLTLTRRRPELLQHLESLGINITSDNTAAVMKADIVILAVKPHQLDEVMEQIKPYLTNQILISVVTGKTLNQLQQMAGKQVALYRAMPNTAIAQRESMTCISSTQSNTEQDAKVIELFSKLGEVIQIQDELMDAATVLGSCGIAYALRYIRAAMQGGIQIGFSSDVALRITAQTVKGAASLLLNQNTHPEHEIDKVTTPQGCTIAGINQMEHEGFSSSLIKGINTSYMAIEEIKKGKK